MKYFTREELEDITTQLIDNPTRETLKNLNEKYNSSEESIAVLNETSNEMLTPITPIEESVVETIPNIIPEQQVVNPIPSVDVPNIETVNIGNDQVNTGANVLKTPSFELPNLTIPSFNNQNNQPINFTGNLFETPSTEVDNLMQTTDNFNTVQNTMPSTEVQVTGTPFFGPISNTVNNPIPVGGNINTMPTQTPTMLGQLEQNYM